MAMILLLGSTGVGLVWGWLMGAMSGRAKQPGLTGLVLSGATLLLAVEVFLLVRWQPLVPFLSSTGLAWVFHIQWRREMGRRFGAPKID